MAVLKAIKNKTTGKFLAFNGDAMYGYCTFEGQYDPQVYEVVTVNAPPTTNLENQIPLAVRIQQARAQMLATYKSVPMELRDIFSTIITRVNALLDLEDYELAVITAQNADTSILTDPQEKALAEEYKAQFVEGLLQMVNPS